MWPGMCTALTLIFLLKQTRVSSCNMDNIQGSLLVLLLNTYTKASLSVCMTRDFPCNSKENKSRASSIGYISSADIDRPTASSPIFNESHFLPITKPYPRDLAASVYKCSFLASFHSSSMKKEAPLYDL